MGIDAADVDGDGLLDVYITHLDFELNRLYHNNGDGSFTDVTYSSGIGNKAMLLSGVAARFIDYDDGGSANHWLEVLLIGTKSNRDGIGSVLKLTSGDLVRVDQAKGGTSYMSASDPRIHFGLGKRTKIDSLVITWPSGQVDKLTNVPPDAIIAVKEGAGIVPHPFPKVHSR